MQTAPAPLPAVFAICIPFARAGYVFTSRTSYSSCGRDSHTCTNKWKCMQRQGAFGHNCYPDICTLPH